MVTWGLSGHIECLCIACVSARRVTSCRWHAWCFDPLIPCTAWFPEWCIASKCPSLSQADPVLENIAQIQVQNLASSIGLPFWKCSFSNWVCPVSDICQYLLSLTPQGNIFFEHLMPNVCGNDLQISEPAFPNKVQLGGNSCQFVGTVSGILLIIVNLLVL